MQRWKRTIKIKHFLSENEDAETIKTAADNIIEARTMSECVIASGVAVALGLVGAYSAMTGDTPALTVGVPTLCMMGAFIAGSHIRGCLRWMERHVREREYLADITIFDLNEQVDEAWRRVEWWKNQAGSLAIELDVAAGSTARSAESNVIYIEERI